MKAEPPAAPYVANAPLVRRGVVQDREMNEVANPTFR